MAENKEIIYKELSYQVLQAVFAVHSTLGPGFSEKIYEEALIVEFERRGIPFQRQHPITVYYLGKPIGTYRIDLVVNEKIVLELKAVDKLTDDFKQQTLSYLKAGHYRLGILINFRTKSVQSVRIANG